MDQRMNGVRADLALRIAALEAASGTFHQMASDLDQVRRIARDAGMFPAVTVAHALECAIARGERGPLIKGWLDILRDAVGCDRTDSAASETYAAACSVRYN